jgi:hypothetical protein
MKFDSLRAPPSGKTLTVYTGFHPPSGKMKNILCGGQYFPWQ